MSTDVGARPQDGGVTAYRRDFAAAGFDLDRLLSEIGDSIVHGFDPQEPAFESLALEQQVHVLATLRNMIRRVLHVVDYPVLEIVTVEWLADPGDGRSEMAALFVEELNLWENCVLPPLQHWVRRVDPKQVDQLSDVNAAIAACRADLGNVWAEQQAPQDSAREEAIEVFMRWCKEPS